jgi:hypothetical protein
MSNQNAFSSLIVARVAVLSLAMLVGPGPARAQNNPSNYIFLLASGLVCDPGDSATCPAVVKSANDDSYEMSGAGTFDAQGKSVQAAGTFTHKSSDGTTLETGVWVASEVVRFDSYGVAPGGLMTCGRAFGPRKLGPKGLPVLSGAMPTGGLAVFRIRLLPMSGASRTAVLQANSALGRVPAERQTEGIRLTLERSGTEFSLEVSGRVMFLSMHPEVGAPVQKTQQDRAPDSSEPPSNDGRKPGK